MGRGTLCRNIIENMERKIGNARRDSGVFVEEFLPDARRRGEERYRINYYEYIFGYVRRERRAVAAA